MLHYPYGEPTFHGRLKSFPEDFVVNEELGFEADGQGGHRLLYVEKSNLSTPALVDRIAADCDLKVRDIGYSGLKDTRAKTRQWISIPDPGSDVQSPESGAYRIIEQALHQRKLKRGSHKTNYFEICLRQVDEFPATSEAQLMSLSESGFVNYFGEQRFGREQDNVEQALIKLANRRLPRWRRGLYISALRSYLFNQILSRRIEAGIWNQPLPGDVFMLQGSHSIFTEAVDDSIRQRFTSFDISSTASLYGNGPCRLSGIAREIEESVFAAHPEITDCLDQQGAKRQMRATRVRPQDFSFTYDAQNQTLHLALRLPAGSYLTSLLDHCMRRNESA